MKHKLKRSGFLALALGLSLLAAPLAEAAVVITNLVLTTTSISFDVSGTNQSHDAYSAASPSSAWIAHCGTLAQH